MAIRFSSILNRRLAVGIAAAFFGALGIVSLAAADDATDYRGSWACHTQSDTSVDGFVTSIDQLLKVEIGRHGDVSGELLQQQAGVGQISCEIIDGDATDSNFGITLALSLSCDLPEPLEDPPAFEISSTCLGADRIFARYREMYCLDTTDDDIESLGVCTRR